MKKLKLLENLKAGREAIGLFAGIDSSLVAEGLASLGYDFVFVDQQHGVISDATALAMITAINTTDCTPVVRVPGNEPGAIMRALDYGAMAVVCPLVNTGEQAAAFVEATRYPPEGGRSWAPVRPGVFHGGDYTFEANKHVMAIAQIETREAVENMDEILSTPNLDAVLVGPNDLGFTYGNWPKSMPEDPAAVEAIREVARQCRARGVYAGIHCGDAAMAREMLDWGYHFTSVSMDFIHLMNGAAASLEELRGTGERSGTGY